jgi:hypothetical protein
MMPKATVAFVFNRVLRGAAISWIYSVTLELLFAACASGRFSWNTLRLPGVVPVALIGSTGAALLMTPIAAWSVRTGMKNSCIYGPVLWVALAAYMVVIMPRIGAHDPYGVFVLGVGGAIVLGLIPVRKRK